jgi:3-oxoacyl-[acyl-carrier-protein] synthase II
LSERRVVVTGVGFACPLGIGSEDVYERFVKGENGVNDTLLDHPVARMADFDPVAVLGSAKEARRLDRATQIGIAAADAALAHAGFDVAALGQAGADARAGVTIGTGIGGSSSLLDQAEVMRSKGAARLSPFAVPMFMPNALSGNLAMRYGFGGPNATVCTACAAGTDAIGHAADLIRSGHADLMLAGGTESSTHEFGLAAFMRAGATSRTGSRPFDANRDGFVLGEGAGVLVLEDYDAAKARDARILAEVAGYGRSADAFHITAPHPEGAGAIRAIHMALEEAQLDPSDVGYVNAHGTSTPLNDAAEALALHAVFGEEVPPTSSCKSMVGHLIGAAGAVEGAVTVLALANGVLPPTINYTTPDPGIDLDVVPNDAREVEGLQAAISNSFGFGGHNAVVALRRA